MILPMEGSYDSLPKFAQKKVDKVIADLFPDKIVEKNLVNLSDNDKAKLSFDFQNGELYSLSSGDSKIGFAYFSKAPSKFLLFDYFIVFNNSLVIVQSEVLVYREDYGGEIANKRWLKQFEGKINGENMEFDKDIDGISGATISCQSMTHGVKKLSKQIHQLKEKGLL